MKTQSTLTHFAPADRLPLEALRQLPEKFGNMEQLIWLERLPLMVFLTNPFRQIVYCNTSFRRLSRHYLPGSVLGLRPGEALGCIHSQEMAGGCGCSDQCRHCGAVRAILKSLHGVESCQECHIMTRDEMGLHAIDMQVLAQPFHVYDQIYSLNTAFDVSHERRLSNLTKSFLHSMVNAAGGMEALLTLVEGEAGGLSPAQLELLHQSAQNMLQEVLYQYDVTAVETDQLAVAKRVVDVAPLIRSLVGQLRHHPTARGRLLQAEGPSCRVATDSRLVRHILGNLIVNALEACQREDVARVSWGEVGAGVVIHVDNPGIIPWEVSRQMFKRYVSTKGEDRGLGLYIAKIMAENHLGASLVYTPFEGGTRFSLTLP
jgi:hypothetical protein